MRHRDTSFGLLLRDQAPERKLPAIAPERNVGVGRKILSENLSTNSIRCSLFCQEVSEQWLVIPGRRCERRPRMYAPSFIAMPASVSARVVSPPSLPPHSEASARCTCVRSRLRARARLAPDGPTNFTNSCVRFIRKPSRTPGMAEMAKMAKVLVLEQHSQFPPPLLAEI